MPGGRLDVRDAIAKVLLASNTLAQGRVFVPRTFPTRSTLFPLILVQMPFDTKIGTSGTLPIFETTAAISIIGRVKGADAYRTEADLEVLADQILDAVNTTPVLTEITRFDRIETTLVVDNSGGEVIGEVGIRLSATFIESFDPPPGADLKTIDLSVPLPDGTDAVEAKIIVPTED